jgi:erythritol transport system substrate-binding protein
LDWISACDRAPSCIEQADSYLKTGKASKPEKQSIDRVLVNSANVAKYTSFNLEK